jgi:N6-adenosine-specific RNA methylase IME4
MTTLRGGFESGRFVHGSPDALQRTMFGESAGYGAILADPPWQFSLRSPKGMGRSPDRLVEKPFGESHANAAVRHYETMKLSEIQALPVGALAAADCALFLWCIDSMLPQAIETGERWGFQYKTIAFVWAKCRPETSRRGDVQIGWDKFFPMGTGYWTRANPELCLLLTRGAPERQSKGVRKLVVAPRREHSRKPDEIRAGVEKLVQGPYLELFARAAAPGWDSWGNQTERFGAAA